jgi:hypothetical protein
VEINDINTLANQLGETDMWGVVTDRTPELYIQKGGQFTVRIIGPVHKASRCYISSDNTIARRLSVLDLKKVLNGSPFELKSTKFKQKSVQEIETAWTKSNWSKCLLTTVVLLSNNKRMPNNQLYYLAIPTTAVRCLVRLTQALKEEGEILCMSGVKACNIDICRENANRADTIANINFEETMLNRAAMENLLSYGLRDAKDHFISLNQKNLNKKSGFFYSFLSDKSSSVLDEYMKPLKQIENYIEEDRQYDRIVNDSKIMTELEGAPLIDFIDIE